MLGIQVFQIVGAIVVHYDVLELPSSEQLFALASGREIGEGGLSQQESAPVEAVRTVDVESTADVIGIVLYKCSAVEDHRRLDGELLGETHEALGKIVGTDDASFAQHQLTMKGAALRARAVR